MASARLQISLLLNGDEVTAESIIDSYMSSTVVDGVRMGMDLDQATVDFMLNNFNGLILTQSEKIQLLKLLNENYIDTINGGTPLGNQELAQRPFNMTLRDITEDNRIRSSTSNALNPDGRFTPNFPLRTSPMQESSTNQPALSMIESRSEDSDPTTPALNVLGQFKMKDNEGNFMRYNVGDVVYYEGNSYVCQAAVEGWVPETAHSGNPWKQIDLPDNNIDGGAEF